MSDFESVAWDHGRFADPSDNDGLLVRLNKGLHDDARAMGEIPALAGIAWDYNRRVSMESSPRRAYEDAFQRISDQVRDATGVDLGNPTSRNTSELARRIAAGEFKGFTDPRIDELLYDRQSVFLAKAAELKAQHPDRLGALDLDTPMPQQAQRMARDADTAMKGQLARDDIGWMSKGAGMLLGGMAAMPADPISAIGMLAPGGGQGVTATGRIINAALVTGLGNAATAAVAQPVVQQWKRAAGLEHGWQDAAQEIGMAFAVGGVLGGGIKGIGEIIGRLAKGKGSVADFEAAVAATGREATPDEKAAFTMAKAADEADAALQKALPGVRPGELPALTRDFFGHLNDAAHPAPIDMDLPRPLTDLDARAAVKGATTLDEAVEALRVAKAAASARMSDDPALQMAGQLSQMNERAFDLARKRNVPLDQAAHIASFSRDPAMQRKLVGLLADKRFQTVFEAREAMTAAIAADKAKIAARARRGLNEKGPSLLRMLAAEGLAMNKELLTLTGGQNPFIPGIGRLMRKTGGMDLDTALRNAIETRYLIEPGHLHGGVNELTPNDLLTAIEAELRGSNTRYAGYVEAGRGDTYARYPSEFVDEYIAREWDWTAQGLTDAQARDIAAEASKRAMYPEQVIEKRRIDAIFNPWLKEAKKFGYVRNKPLEAEARAIMSRENITDVDRALEIAAIRWADEQQPSVSRSSINDSLARSFDDMVAGPPSETGGIVPQPGRAADIAGGGRPAETAGDNARVSGQGDRAPKTPDRVLDRRIIEVDGQMVEVAPEAIADFAPRESHIADVIRACKV